MQPRIGSPLFHAGDERSSRIREAILFMKLVLFNREAILPRNLSPGHDTKEHGARVRVSLRCPPILDLGAVFALEAVKKRGDASQSPQHIVNKTREATVQETSIELTRIFRHRKNRPRSNHRFSVNKRRT